MKSTLEIEIPALASMGEGMVTIPFEGAIEQASVYVSPGSTMSGLMIGYARVCTPGNVEVKFMNMSTDMEEPMSMVLHIMIIQCRKLSGRFFVPGGAIRPGQHCWRRKRHPAASRRSSWMAFSPPTTVILIFLMGNVPSPSKNQDNPGTGFLFCFGCCAILLPVF
jgi:hypothetical protein